MSNVIFIFIIFVFSISLIISVIGEITFYGKDVDIDSQYLDEDGDHIYYDRSLIEKKIFRRMFPHITNLRSLKQLFK